MKIVKLILFFNLLLVNTTSKPDMVSLVPFLPADNSEVTVNFSDTIDKRLKVLEEEKKNVLTKEQLSSRLESINSEIISLKEKQKNSSSYDQQDFFQKRLSISNQKYQILMELEHINQQCVQIIEEHSDILKAYKDDPNFNKLKTPVKAYYTFEDLQDLSARRIDYEEKVSSLEDKKQTNLVDLNNKKKAQSIALQEYKEKKKQQEDFVLKLKKGGYYNNMRLQDQGILLDEQEKLWGLKKELSDFKVLESELKDSFIRSQIEITSQQTILIKSEYERVKKIVKVDESTLTQSGIVLEKARQESLFAQEVYKEKIAVLMAIKNGIKNQIINLSKRFDLSQSDINSIAEFNFEPTSLGSWAAFCFVANVANHNVLLDTQKDFLDAQIELEKNKFKIEELKNRILKSWHKMTSGSFEFSTDEEIDQEIRDYNTLKTEYLAELNSTNDKRNSIATLLNNLNSQLEKLRIKIRLLSQERDTFFKDNLGDYTQCLAHLNDTEEQMKLKLDTVSKLAEIYSANISSINSAIKKIDNVISELSSKSFWRSANEALINRLVNFIPDIEIFFKDLFKVSLNRVSKFSLVDQIKNIYNFLSRPLSFVYFLISLLLSLGIFLLGIRYLPDLNQYIYYLGRTYLSLSSISEIFTLLLDFVIINFKSLYTWIILFLAFRFSGIFSPYYGIIFYLGSIFYLIYIINQFIAYIVQVNESHGYIILNQNYQKRFITVISGLFYGTAILQLFRLAFLLGNYPHSDVPTVLIAINFIILQISLICLIGKEQILSIIPTNTPLWEWVHEHVKKYYYLFVAFLIVVIVMSNPYVGFGRQVFYVLSRIIITLLLFPIFSFVQNILKRGASDLFFYNDGDNIKERFDSSKSWYGLFIISTFILFSLFGFIIAAKIWGNTITFNDISNWLNKDLPIAGYDALGKRIEVTPFSFFKILLFIAIGIFIAYVVNKFILQRIFSLLLVSAGIQSMFLTLTRYFILIMALLIGIQSSGLSSILWYIAALVGGIAFAMKEPVSDVISYFIILVQRPIKIGDFIMIDDTITGVVRYITPRSVLIRKKNSMTIVVPNSHIITKPIFNWNASRSFFAFNDIMITIPYSFDPALVKQIMLKVLQSNPNILKNPPPIIWLSDFTENGFLFMVRGFLSPDKVLEQWEISSEIRFELVKMLRKNSIDIAQPTRIIKVNSGTQVPAQFEDKI